MTTNGVSGGGASSDTTGTQQATNKEVTKDAFLQLLVAQIKNQDPLNPTDGVQFLSQLAQFSELEQLIGIRGDLQQLTTELTPAEKTNQGA
jgi:flagellar basal-body rod modification protein FlgD